MRKLLCLVAFFSLLSPAGAIEPGAPTLEAKAWILVDVTSGQILAEHEADTRFEPASLTTLMTAYLAFTAIKEKRLDLAQRPPVSMAAYKAIGSRMFVEPTKPATVDELLHGMIVQSGNDASIVLAEAVAGSESAFADLMNREARHLGLKNTSYRNSTGLPDPEHYASARDLATLAIALIEKFPKQYARLYSQKEYTYNKIKQRNRNRLLFADPSVDGVKTGHTEAAGYCLVASAVRAQAGGKLRRRLLSVVLGAGSMSARAIESQKLLNYGFQNFEAISVYKADEIAGRYRVWKGTADRVGGGFEKAVVVTVGKGKADRLKAEIERVEPLVAPIVAGQKIGSLRVTLDGKQLTERALVAREPVAQAGWIGRLWDSLRLMVKL
ncbi:MAG: D-alanyl-D-alanine carboxypeptidase family protein [Burkholderiaceae bacterium]